MKMYIKWAGNDKMKDLSIVVNTVLIISYGNSLEKGGFSINKEMLIENVPEERILHSE